MTNEEAKHTLRSDGTWPDLLEAIGVLAARSDAPLADLVLGLRYGGVVAEQAAFALYRRTNTPLPSDRSRIEMDESRWRDRAAILEQGNAQSRAR